MFGPLRQLTDFSGRSTRAQFWPFAFFLYAAQQIVSMIVMNPFMTKIQKIGENGEAVLLLEGAKADLIQTFSAMFGTIFILSGIMMLLSMALLAAVVTRRLHDTNRSGWWALPTALLGVAAMVLMYFTIPALFGSTTSVGETFDFGAFLNALMPMFGLNFIYLISAIALIIFCARDGTIGDNRYGPDPKGRDPAGEAVLREQKFALQQNREAARTDPSKRPPAARVNFTDKPDTPD